MIELICVRHGRTAWNADLRFQGQSDVPLDDEGRAQAAVLAAFFKDKPLAMAASSDLSRAAETARTILAHHPAAPLRLDPDLREMAFGAWEGLTWAQIVERDPQMTAAAARDGALRPKHYTPADGERFEDVVQRAARAVERIRREAVPGSRVLVVTHAGVLHALLRVILGEDEASMIAVRFTPASISRFAVAPDGGGRLLALNRTP
ncbi:MAG: histidine phosphatase family protein [Candidatus Eremiobacteraeota bacterium]|nr:histidine phosphatase family protein [Candidatus Eremiobacteraeota bacterium]